MIHRSREEMRLKNAQYRSERMTKQYTPLYDTIPMLSMYQAANKPDQSNIHYNIQ
jgi:hypothetical protein